MTGKHPEAHAMVTSEQRAVPAEVTFACRGRSLRCWEVRFDLGTDAANADAVMSYAWKHNASIIATNWCPNCGSTRCGCDDPRSFV